MLASVAAEIAISWGRRYGAPQYSERRGWLWTSTEVTMTPTLTLASTATRSQHRSPKPKPKPHPHPHPNQITGYTLNEPPLTHLLYHLYRLSISAAELGASPTDHGASPTDPGASPTDLDTDLAHGTRLQLLLLPDEDAAHLIPPPTPTTACGGAHQGGGASAGLGTFREASISAELAGLSLADDVEPWQEWCASLGMTAG